MSSLEVCIHATVQNVSPTLFTNVESDVWMFSTCHTGLKLAWVVVTLVHVCIPHVCEQVRMLFAPTAHQRFLMDMFTISALAYVSV